MSVQIRQYARIYVYTFVFIICSTGWSKRRDPAVFLKINVVPYVATSRFGESITLGDFEDIGRLRVSVQEQQKIIWLVLI